MKPKLITSITLLMFMLTVGCGQKHPTHVAQHQPEAAQKAKPQTNKTQPAESFTDSLNIGRKGLNKVRLEQFRKEPDSTYVVIRFFSKHGDKWILKNEFHLPKDGITGPDPLISDFNNDGLKDFTFISAIAARGGNEIRTLFIYDKKNDDLVLIKNSDTFPNLSYNKDLNCIESLGLSGCNTTSFTNIESDSLKEFAWAEQCDSITVYAYDKKGREKVILKRSIKAGDDMVFTDYNLLKKYSKR